MWHKLRFVVNIRTNKKKLATEKKNIYTCATHKTRTGRKMVQMAQRSHFTIVSLRRNSEVNQALPVDRKNNGNEGGEQRGHGDVARREEKNPRRRNRIKNGRMAQLPSLLVCSGLPHAPLTRGAARDLRHERVQANGAKRAQFWRVLLLQARNVITASLACGTHCLPGENRRRGEAGTPKRRVSPSPQRTSLEKSTHSRCCTPHPRAHSLPPPSSSSVLPRGACAAHRAQR